MALRADEGRAGIKTDARFARDQGIGRKARIKRGVGYDEDFFADDGMRTKGDIP